MAKPTQSPSSIQIGKTFHIFTLFLILFGVGGVINVLVLEISQFVFLLDNEAKQTQNTKHFNNRIRSDKALT
ncbi:hypothetical protein B1772_01190 [Dehalococcoides mccartyi]|nr:hypothetical protein B1772_01190 [Dehalococcoides mccartyi]